MAKMKTKFVCQSCGTESPKWMGRCSGCGEWNTMVEEVVEEKKARRGSAFVHTTTKQLKPERLANIVSQEESRVFTGSSEFDRVLGGGIVPGSMVLVGGDPGIGKSTILLQTSARLAQRGEKVLYISGEESLKQTKLRAERLGLPTQDLFVLSETDMNMIERVVDEE
ncbi:MAG: ATPase domain-containing protein, partial [Exiguobacterium oxidotolerans]